MGEFIAAVRGGAKTKSKGAAIPPDKSCYEFDSAHTPSDWTTEMSVGVPALDEHHQTLLAVVRQLQQAMAEGRAREKLDGVIAGILRYAEMPSA